MASENETTLAVIKGITVVQDDDGRVHWQSGAAVDADGANGQNGNAFAYREDDTGLDALANAGYPNKSWRDVLVVENDKPKDDGNGNWYSMTTYAWKTRPIETRYVDSTAVPYVVVNPHVRVKAKGVVIGCKARVTYKSKNKTSQVDAVVADVSGGNDIGELSIAAAEKLGIPSNPRYGGVDSGVTFELWPDQAATINGEVYELQSAGG